MRLSGEAGAPVGKDVALQTSAGDSVYGEKRISVEGEKEGEKIEYRVWNPFRCILIVGRHHQLWLSQIGEQQPPSHHLHGAGLPNNVLPW